MYGAGYSVDIVELADVLDQFIDVGLIQGRCLEFNLVQFVDSTTEDGALSAAAGDDAPLHFFLPVADANAGMGCDINQFAIPVHDDRFDIGDIFYQFLIVYVAEGQGFGLGAKRHQGNHFHVIDSYGQWQLPRNVYIDLFAKLVGRIDAMGGLQTRRGHFRFR